MFLFLVLWRVLLKAAQFVDEKNHSNDFRICNFYCKQFDQIGQFSLKICPYFGNSLGYFTFKNKLLWLLLGKFCKNGLLISPDHADCMEIKMSRLQSNLNLLLVERREFESRIWGKTLLVNGSVCASHPAALGSTPKHNIYAFFQFTNLKTAAGIGPHWKWFYSMILFDNRRPRNFFEIFSVV